jgi:hypothetical protein
LGGWIGRYLRKGVEQARRAGVEAVVGVHRERKVAERRTKKSKMRELSCWAGLQAPRTPRSDDSRQTCRPLHRAAMEQEMRAAL